MDVVLRNDVASLGVTVKLSSGSDVPATIVVVPARGANMPPRTTQYSPSRDPTGGRSESEISSLAPGAYLVLAFDRIDGLEYFNPDVLQNYLSQATPVTIAPNQRAQVTVDLIRTADSSN
jgi:hypothetical protein